MNVDGIAKGSIKRFERDWVAKTKIKDLNQNRAARGPNQRFYSIQGNRRPK